MEISGKTVLVTGADGFIGSHLVEALVEHGANVRALAYYNSFSSRGWLEHLPPATAKSVEIRDGDIRDPHFTAELVRGTAVVFHLAALIGIPFSYVSPDLYVETNVRGTLNVLNAARAEGVKVVHTSTSEVYGTAVKVPITEDHPLRAQSPYAATKIAADQLALSYHLSFGLPVTVVRPFNTYGPRQSTRAFIPTIITQLAKGNATVAAGSLHPTRDFTFVGDAARGFIAAATSDRTAGEVIHLSSNFEISMKDTAELIARLMGKKLAVRTEEERVRPGASEVERLWGDNRKAADLTGWTPRLGGREGFECGLKETIAWFSDPANLTLYRRQGYAL